MLFKNNPSFRRLGDSPSPLLSFVGHPIFRSEHLALRPLLPKLAAGVAIAWCTNSFAAPAFAASMSFGNDQIRFGEDTTLESSFVESHGAYQSTFGVINLDTNEKTPLLVESRAADQPDTVFRPSTKTSDLESAKDFRGTPGNSVSQPSARFNFKANTNYAFYLESSYNGRPVGMLYSSDVLNPNKERQVRFSGTDMTSLCQGGSVIAWDDTGSKLVRDREQQDRDFDDFVVQLRNTACPVGGGELPDAPPAATAPVGELPLAALPAAGGSKLGLLGLLPLALLPAFLGGNDKGTKGIASGVTTSPPGGDKGTKGVDDDTFPPRVTPPPGVTPPTPPGKAVPEPFTIVGSTTAIGLAAVLQRRRSKKRK
jgi:hypothetical protein